MTTRVRLTPYDKDTTKVNLTDYDDEVLGDDFLVTGTINKVVINIADRKSEEASYIPQGFKQPRSKRDIKNIILKPVSKEGGNYSCTDPNVLPAVEFDDEGHLTSDNYFSTLIYNTAHHLDVPEYSPLRPAWDEFVRLSTKIFLVIHSCRVLVQNAARSIVFVQKAYEAGRIEMGAFKEVAEALHSVFVETAAALADVPPDFPVPGLPEAFIIVTYQLKDVMESTGLDLHLICSFNDKVGALSIPIILHPALDTSFEDLQISLVNITKSYHQLTPLAAYRQCMKAFGEVNDSMFMDPMDCEAKGDAFNRVLAEFRRCYLRNVHHTQSTAWWMASTLFQPHFLDEWGILVGYLYQCVELITGRPYAAESNALQFAIEEDDKSLVKFWGLNIQAAINDRCKNLRVCGALNDFPQLVRQEIQIVRDRDAGNQAAKQAWNMLQTATSGSYEHRALTYALFEVRRALHGALEEWELLDREVSLGEVLGEGGSAMVYYGRFLDGPAAVKVFKRPSLSESSASSVPSLDSSDMLVTLSSQDMDSYVHKRELQMWFRLSHPHVMPFVGCCLTSPSPMIVTPIAPGGSARAYRNAHPEADWLKILTQVASGVHYLHTDAFMIHGDLKGRNILMDADGTPKISDFGLALMTESVHGKVNSSGGTAQWMAPELLDGSGFLSYEADIYALAMTFYELWFDKNPFDLMEPDLVREMVLDVEVRPEREIVPPMPDKLWTLLERCWLAKPSARPSSTHVLSEMQDISGYVVEEESASPVRAPVRQNSGHSRPYNIDIDIDALECASLHGPADFPDREKFPFVSSGYLVSFALRRETEIYLGRKNFKVTRVQYLETPHDGIWGSPIEHPVQKIIFRIKSQTDPEMNPEFEQISWLGCYSRFEAVLLRRNGDGQWKDVPEATQHLHDINERCNFSVAHVTTLDSTSNIARHAIAGDKVALCAYADYSHRLTIKSAEIEMHVQLRRAKL